MEHNTRHHAKLTGARELLQTKETLFSLHKKTTGVHCASAEAKKDDTN